MSTMKKIYNIIAVALACVATASCAKEMIPSASQDNVLAEGLVEKTFVASRGEDLTKADLQTNLSTKWNATDTIAIWDGEAVRKFSVASLDKDGAVATFTGAVSETATSFVAVYPFTAFTSCSDAGLKVNIPATQTVAEGQIADPNALVSYAYAEKADAALSFKNLTSLARITVSAAAPAIKFVFSGNAAEKVCGACTVVTDKAEVSSIACEGAATINFSSADGANLKAGNYFLALAPATFDSGVTVIASDSTSTCVRTSQNALALLRNHGVSLGDVKATGTPLPKEIASVDDYLTFGTYATYYTSADVLTISADLDLQGAELTTPARFLGSIDGQNHRIYNYVIKSGVGTPNAGDAAVFGRVGAGKEAEPYYIKNIAFGTKDYDFATGKGTYDGVSKVTYESLNNGNDTYYYPGAVAYCYAYGTIENLVNFTPVEITSKCETPHRAGALLGTVKANVTIKDCTNYADLSDATQTCTKNPTVAGLVGALDGADCVVEGCKNYGNITVTSPKILDFAGLVAYDNYVATFKNCENHGNVTGKYELSNTTQLGGITSRATKGGTVFENCLNTGKVSAEFTGAFDVFAAGITGRAYGCDMTNVDNSGEVSLTVTNTGKNAFVGGVIANSVNQNNVLSKMVDCDNSGKVVVSGSGNRATNSGINGYNANNAPGLEMTNCHNTGELINAYSGTAANGGVGGVLCFSSGKTTMKNCSNKGNITFSGNVGNNTYVGGISSIWGTVATHVMDGCVNEGAIVIDNSNMTDESKILSVGGVAATTYGSLKNCVNKGTITTGTAAKSARLCVGGVCGGNYYLIPSVEGCTNEGAITVGTVSTAASNNIGGIVGPLSAKVLKNCSNKGNITVTGSAANLVFVGGIAGAALAKETGIAGELPATVGLDGCSVDCAIVTDSANAGHAGSVLGNVTVATEIALGATTPIAVKGSINGTALAAGALQTLGSAVTATNVTVNAVLAE